MAEGAAAASTSITVVHDDVQVAPLFKRVLIGYNVGMLHVTQHLDLFPGFLLLFSRHLRSVVVG